MPRLRERLRRLLRGFVRRWREWPLRLTLGLGDLVFRRWPQPPRSAPPAALNWGLGVSIIIPERGGGELLTRCLAGLFAATATLDEPCEVIIVVNGSPEGDYAALAQRYPAIRWCYFDHALGFTRAVLQGIALARFGAIYLLNNDMLLEPDALRKALAWRAPHVFAVASQILFPSDGRRREETGWTFMPMADGLPAPYHAESTHDVARGTVWAGAGSALFHAGMLRELMPGSLPFDPFYWEDVDLGVRAWHAGYDSVYCPESRALHLHRVTVKRYFEAAEVERIFERNRLQLQLRNPFPLQPLASVKAQIRRLDAITLGELGSLSACRALWRARWQAWRAPYRDLDYAQLPRRSFRALASAPILLVSPFALLPPRHGGALRTQRLATELARDYPLILLSDEAGLYGEPDHPSYAPFAQVHLVDGRPAPASGQEHDRISRMRTHAHPALRLELRRLIELHRPRAVLIEHMELAGLVDLEIDERPPFVLNLQDVLLTPDEPAAAATDRHELDLIDRFDALVVCSAEDQALLRARDSVLVRNGCDVNLAASYQPSEGRNILFLGPFRAPINWDGIRDFVASVYPQLQQRVPGISLTIVGGTGARARVADLESFQCPSILVLDAVEAVDELLAAAALSINPQPQLRGSSLKVIESLAAGRVCVSTEAGARGHCDAGFAGLVVCRELADFLPVLSALLLDDTRRHRLERPDLERLSGYAWQRCADPLRALLRRLVEARA